MYVKEYLGREVGDRESLKNLTHIKFLVLINFSKRSCALVQNHLIKIRPIKEKERKKAIQWEKLWDYKTNVSPCQTRGVFFLAVSQSAS